MNVLYLSGAPRVSTSKSAEATGARAHVLGVINALENIGYKVDKYIVGDLYVDKLKNRNIQKKMSSSSIKRVIADIARLILAWYHGFKAYKKHTNSKNINFVYERFGAFQLMGKRFSKNGIKWILETNNPLFAEVGKDRKSIFFERLAIWYERRAYEKCDLLICVTNELKKIITDHYEIDERKILVVPNGVDVERFDPEKHVIFEDNNQFTIGFVGNLYKWAGIDLLLESIQELDEDIKLTIIGDGIEKDSLLKKASDLGFTSDTIEFKGRVCWNNIPQLIKGFDIAYSGQKKLSTGRMYHSPLKLYEYMSMGCPVLASSFDDSEKLIEDGINGFLFESENKDDLKQKILEAISKDKHELKTIGSNARKTIIENHSWNQRVQQILKVLNSKKEEFRIV